jgi:hypothetical protein
MKDMNVVFFKDKYQKYKDAVISLLKARGINAYSLGQYFEEYCTDFFLDHMSEEDCASAFASDRIAKEKMLTTEAKRIMREHGYRVKILKD